jgi:hypothetical protein
MISSSDASSLGTLLFDRLVHILRVRFREVVSSNDLIHYHERHFIFCSLDFLFARPVNGTFSIRSWIDHDKQIKNEVIHKARVLIWFTGSVESFEDWNSFRNRIIGDLLSSLNLRFKNLFSYDSLFQIISNMIGKDAMRSLIDRFNSLIDESKADSNGLIAAQIEQYRAQLRDRQIGQLRKFISDYLSYGVISEDDVVQCWRAMMLATVMEA